MKKIVFVLGVLFYFFGNLISQNIPCPAIKPGLGNGGTNTICSGQCAPLSATVVTNNQTTNYNVAAIPYTPYGYTGTPVLNGNDDQWSDSISLGFSFCYFGNSYTKALIGSNGELCFDLTQLTACGSNTNPWKITGPLPIVGGCSLIGSPTDAPANTICAAFRDIDCSKGGSILYQYAGTSPCRALVISWVNVPLFDDGSCTGLPRSTFQLVLYENTNYIDVYIQNSTSCHGWNKGYGEIGLNNKNGSLAVVPPGRNYPGTWTAVNEAWRFSPSGTPSYSLTWTDPTGVVGTGLNVNVCPTTNTTYTATMVLTNCNGSTLTLSDTTTVFVKPGVVLSVNSPTICSGTATTLTVTGGTTYTWSANAGSATTNTVSVSPNATTIYTVTGPNNGACTPVATATVTVVPSVSITVNAPAAICLGATTTLTANGAPTYSWSPGTGLSSTSGNSVIASPNTTTVYTVTGYNGNCPSATATTTVSVIPTATITVNSATICPTTSAILIANGSATYSWNPGTGLNSTSGSTVKASPAATTVYTVSGSTCVTPGTSTVTVIPSCSITVNSAAICPGASATLTANGGGPYTWSPATGLSSTSDTSVIANPTATTVYTVTSSSGGFTATATSTVTVNQQPVVTVNNVTICQGSSADLMANGALTYNWSPPTGLSSTTTSMVVASPTTTTSYTVIGIAANTCTNSAIATVGVNPAPIVTISSLNSSGCAPFCENFTGTSSTTSQSCDWTFGDGNISKSCAAANCYKAAGNYIVTLTINDNIGCKGTGTASVTVFPAPLADFSASPQPATILDPKIQFIDLTTNAIATKWNWDFGALGGADTSRLKNPSYNYPDTGTYLVQMIVSTAFGCKDTTTKTVRINDDYELFVPSAFSPNNDGLNDVFLPVASGVASAGYHLYIYDRWDNLIFQTTDLNQGWDGVIHGNAAPLDVYIWKIILKTTAGVSKQMSGRVSLVK